MYKNTIKNKIINKHSKSVIRVNDLIKKAKDLIDYSETDSMVSTGYVNSEYFIGWKSSAEAFLSSLDRDNFYNNFAKYVNNDSEQAVDIGISILINSRDHIRFNMLGINLWNYSNPFWLVYQLFKMITRKKILIQIVLGVLVSLIVYYVVRVLELI